MAEQNRMVVTRLVDMTRMHPQQDNSHRCSGCLQPVGIYPSGMALIRRMPGLIILCSHCAHPQPGDVARPTARNREEFQTELAQSVKVTTRQ